MRQFIVTVTEDDDKVVNARFDCNGSDSEVGSDPFSSVVKVYSVANLVARAVLGVAGIKIDTYFDGEKQAE